MALSNPKTSGHPLGALISNHPQTVVGNRGRMIQTSIALGIGTLLLLAGLIVFVAMAEAASQLTLICLGFGGFCALGIGLLGLGDARRTLDMSLELYERGLRYTDRHGQKQWAWSDITQLLFNTVRVGNTNRYQYVYQINHAGGDSIVFYDHIRDPAGAFSIIAKYVYPLLLPSLLADSDAGKTIQFGAVTLEPTGIRLNNKLMSWADVAGARVSGGSLFIDKRDPGLFGNTEMNTGEVPNADLLVQLVNRRIGSVGYSPKVL